MCTPTVSAFSINTEVEYIGGMEHNQEWPPQRTFYCYRGSMRFVHFLEPTLGQKRRGYELGEIVVRRSSQLVSRKQKI